MSVVTEKLESELRLYLVTVETTPDDDPVMEYSVLARNDSMAVFVVINEYYSSRMTEIWNIECEEQRLLREDLG